MAQKILKTRIKQRIDTAENWAKITEAPLEGEIIIYKSTDDTIPDKIKIGDGATTASNLPFITDVDTNNLSAGVRIPESDANSLGSVTQGIYWENGRPKLMAYTLEKSVPSNAVFTDTNTKVTSAANHYAPQTDSASALNVDASSTTAATWGTTSLVTGVNLTRDAKGHVTGMTVDSIKMPADPTYTLPVAKYNTLGGVKPAYTSTGSAVLTTTAATNTTTPTIQKKSTTSTRYYGVEADANGVLFVNVPWTGDITSVTAGDGLTGGGTSSAVTLAVGAGSGITVTADAVGHTNSVTADTASEGGTARTLNHGDTFNIPSVTYDTEGHITAKGSTALTLPSLPNAGASLGVVKTGGIATIVDGVITAVSGAGDADHATNSDYASEAEKLKTPVTIALDGDVSGSTTFDGSTGVTITTTVANNSHNHNASNITAGTLDAARLPNISIDKLVAGTTNTTIPSNLLPAYVDDVLEYTAKANFPSTGATGKIYVDKTTNLTYRWGGSAYVEISPSLALGETESTAHRGDHGAAAYAHATAKGSAFSSGLYKITTNSEGHVTAATKVVKADITGLGIPGSDTHYTANLYLGASGASSNATTAVNNPYLVLRENSTTRNSIQLKAGTGMSVSGISGAITIGHSNSITAATAQGSATGTLSFGGTFTIPTITYDDQGHITGKGTTTLTMPANPNTDTHWTANLITGASATATANAAASDGSVYLNLIENGSVRNSHLIDGAGTVTVASDANGKITITGSAHPTVNNVKITLSAVDGLTGGGDFTLNQSSAETFSFGHSNSVTAGTAQGGSGQLSHGGTFTVPTITYDAQGHITAKGTTTYTLPTDNNTDTKVTQAAAITTDGNYPVLLAYSTATSSVTNTVNKSTTLLYNPSTGTLSATKFSGNGNSLTDINAVQLTLADNDELILDCND